MDLCECLCFFSCNPVLCCTFGVLFLNVFVICCISCYFSDRSVKSGSPVHSTSSTGQRSRYLVLIYSLSLTLCFLVYSFAMCALYAEMHIQMPIPSTEGTNACQQSYVIQKCSMSGVLPHATQSTHRVSY